MMERELSLLYEAAHDGNVTTLRRLLEQERLILDRVITNNNGHYSETPLHVAAMLGHADFVENIIARKPELAGELDAWQSTPLHLAVAKGHLETVRALLSVVDREVVWSACDGEGRSPLHIAAERGKLEVLRELLKVAPYKAGRVSLNMLHVCVRSNQLEALKILVAGLDDDYRFVNDKDDYGMTVLHLAVIHKQLQTVKFLLTNTRVEVNATNANKLTALDILAQSPRNEKDLEISEFLRSMGASRTIDNEASSSKTRRVHQAQKSKDEKTTANKPENWLSRKRQTLMVVASLIATMAFQAGSTPPSNLWNDEKSVSATNNNNATAFTANSKPIKLFGKEIIKMSYTIDKIRVYHVYLFSNTIGFVGSLSIILLLVTGLPFCHKLFMWILTVILWVTLTAMTFTYMAVIFFASAGQDAMTAFTLICLIVFWCGVMLVIVLLHLIRIVINFFKWLGKFIFGIARKHYRPGNVETLM